MSFYSLCEELKEVIQSPLDSAATELTHSVQMLQQFNTLRESMEKQEQEECAEWNLVCASTHP